MIEIKKLIPQVYNQSRDFGVFTGLMQILINELDQKSRILSELPVESILIGKLRQYPEARESFRILLKNKGNIRAILYAISLSGGLLNSFSEEDDYLSGEGYENYLEDGYLDRTLDLDGNISEDPTIDKSKLVYYESFNDNGLHLLYVNIKDPDKINQDLLKILFYYLKPINTQVILKPI